MSRLAARALLLSAIMVSAAKAEKCIAIEEAAQHIGKVRCVGGTVKNIGESKSGVTFINFCEDYRRCPFTAVVFPRDLRHVGDVRQLVGKRIEVEGKLRIFDGRPEIILKRPRQLGGVMSKLPPVPKEYDVEKRGRFSAGRYAHPEAARRTHGGRKSNDAGIPAEQPVEE
jgi:hypothetical protein